MPVWNDKMTWQQATSGQVSVNSAFTCSLPLSTVYHFGSSNAWVLQHHFVHTLDMSTIIVFVHLGLQYKLNQLSANTSRHSSCIHKGLHAGKWPDLMTSKPDALSTLEYHWTCWTGTTLADAIAQWSSSGNPVLIHIIGIHWKTTGATSKLGCHWGEHPVVSQWQSSVNLHNWNTLDHHWKSTGSTLETHNSLQWHSSVHWGLNSTHTGSPLDCHLITTGSG